MKNYIIVATHKKTEFPILPECYHIFKNGSSIQSIDEYNRDDKGDNISNLQPLLCELTSLYYVWKNVDFDVIGLCHYRRYFEYKNHIITGEEIEDILKNYDVILPKKSKYFLMTPSNYYIKFHSKKTKELRKHYISLLYDVIMSEFPEYYKSMKYVFRKHSSHMKNMFIMKKEHADDYCAFLFSVLDSINQRELLKNRALGTLGEFIIDIWIHYNNVKYIELKIFETEKQGGILSRVWKKLKNLRK